MIIASNGMMILSHLIIGFFVSFPKSALSSNHIWIFRLHYMMFFIFSYLRDISVRYRDGDEWDGRLSWKIIISIFTSSKSQNPWRSLHEKEFYMITKSNVIDLETIDIFLTVQDKELLMGLLKTTLLESSSKVYFVTCFNLIIFALNWFSVWSSLFSFLYSITCWREIIWVLYRSYHVSFI